MSWLDDNEQAWMNVRDCLVGLNKPLVVAMEATGATRVQIVQAVAFHAYMDSKDGGWFARVIRENCPNMVRDKP